MAETGFMDYVKRAFLYHWNLGLLGAGVVGALLSPVPEAGMALMGALEMTYLTLLMGNGKFRTSVEADIHQAKTAEQVDSSRDTLAEVLGTLPHTSQMRFEDLLGRCNEMRELAENMHKSGDGVSKLRTTGMDQLLWGFVRMLVHQETLRRLISSIESYGAEDKLKEVQAGLKKAEASGDERLKKSFTDRLATMQDRINNITQSRKDLTYVSAEIDRIEENIQALAEKAVSQGGLDILSAEIDAAAKSVNETEQTIGSWQSVESPAISSQAPVILDAARERVHG